ncbi:hypothetical protein JNUCC0626_16615 [Lentzea sp. JNUCC 0626]|uniref:hypothetical protein n=1 Tax=Lentzea sp. JNUCC 0626 TaxID=3367513 RepID=UPI003748AAB5
MAELGEEVERYDVDNRRRAVRGVVEILVGTPALAFGVFLVLALDVGRAGAVMFVVGIMIGGGLGVVVLGTILAVQAVTRVGERFVLHEGGLVHSWGDRRTVALWTDVAAAVDLGKKTFLAKALGVDVRCQITLVDGSRVTIGPFVDGAGLLIRRVLEATA